ncbi:glucosaminidase domain-containing protein [Ammoniphilus sp. CFH 90114]|uniref:glucosaminidase domain-containing protein n=1 Tax=Ammoniphilus sp. CFH 90114 TaxID=2493665 RepID=UPI00100F93B5|nr:glucosaminidase domain-containing protein [Ammoniphilus sp. CFH 90114]RXT02854.1 hypothetical protein EIZ39_23985 [Ammoniphilus sp. CFH 90114]
MATIQKNPIMGSSQASVNQMIAFVQRVNPNFNPAIARAFLPIGARYGVRGDVAFCQSIHETNWFRYGGDVRADQNNFAGIGATGGVPGNQFPSIEAGVTAQIQHLFAYATTSPLPQGEALVDPRFNLVQRGSAPYWEDLAGKWAVPGYDRNRFSSLQQALEAGESYGQQIMSLFRSLLQTTAPVAPAPEPTPAPTPAPGGYPPNTALWKQEAVDWMYEQGLLTDSSWKQRIEEPLPLWAEAVVLRRMMERLS